MRAYHHVLIIWAVLVVAVSLHGTCASGEESNPPALARSSSQPTLTPDKQPPVLQRSKSAPELGQRQPVLGGGTQTKRELPAPPKAPEESARVCKEVGEWFEVDLAKQVEAMHKLEVAHKAEEVESLAKAFADSRDTEAGVPVLVEEKASVSVGVGVIPTATLTGMLAGLANNDQRALLRQHMTPHELGRIPALGGGVAANANPAQAFQALVGNEPFLKAAATILARGGQELIQRFLSGGTAGQLHSLYINEWKTGTCALTATGTPNEWQLAYRAMTVTYNVDNAGRVVRARFRTNNIPGSAAGTDNLDRVFVGAMGVGKHNGVTNGGLSMSDQAGHIVANEFAGSPCLINYVPMAMTTNAHPESQWKVAEATVAAFVRAGCTVDVDIVLDYGFFTFYPGRPYQFTYNITPVGVCAYGGAQQFVVNNGADWRK